MSPIAHLAIKVDNVEQAAAFWQKAFGFTRYGCEIPSEPGVMPIRFRDPGGIIAEIAPAGVYPGVTATSDKP